MSFGSMLVNSRTYNESQKGRYMDSTVTFGSPQNYFSLRGGSSSKGQTVAAISRILQKNVVIGSDAVIKTCTVSCPLTIPTGFTVAEVDGLLLDISEFANIERLNRLLTGES